MAFGVRLDNLELTNFHGFSHFDISFDNRLTVLVGENGSGKTSVLQAACVALDAFVSHLALREQRAIAPSDARFDRFEMGGVTDWQGQYPVVVAARGLVGDDDGKMISWERQAGSSDDRPRSIQPDGLAPFARACSERLKKGDQSLVLPMIAYYGTGRLWGGKGGALNHGMTRFSRQDGYRGALDASVDNERMLSWFYKMTAQDVQRVQSLRPMDESPLFAAVRNAVERCFCNISGCEQVKVTYNLDVNDLDVEFFDQEGGLHKLAMGLMSDGYRTTLSMFADIAYRMALLNPALGERVLDETPGIVLIDEADLHLHPLWQARILRDLCDAFPRVQFIVTTHAPMVISSVPGRQVRILNGEGAHVPEHESFGLGANDVLTGIMGAESRQSVVTDLLARFARLLDGEDYDAAGRVLDELEEKTGPSNPDVVAARSALAFERL
ncbi:MAG TPA: AAA family ATPase [Candidatus Olsenella pullicola]|nr:AAA family ATPase [Candidatus Olsenella pullicola]